MLNVRNNVHAQQALFTAHAQLFAAVKAKTFWISSIYLRDM
jgi:hypothetical protein